MAGFVSALAGEVAGFALSFCGAAEDAGIPWQAAAAVLGGCLVGMAVLHAKGKLV